MIEFLTHTKVIEWSENDQCFIGHCPGIIGPCCHGDSREQVERELHQIVKEWLEIDGENIRIESQVSQVITPTIIEFPLNDKESFEFDIFSFDELFNEQIRSQQFPFQPLTYLSKMDEEDLHSWETEGQLLDHTFSWMGNDAGMIQERVNSFFHQIADAVNVDKV